MIRKHVYKELIWIDLETPTTDEVRGLMEEYSIQPLVAEELLSPTLRPKVDVYKNNIYLILHFPSLKKDADGKSINQEIDFVLGERYIITSHHDRIEGLYHFAKRFEANSLLEKSEIGNHAGYIFYYMLKTVYHHLLDELDYIHGSLTKAETRIFAGEEKDMVLKLSEINREILTFREAINIHKEVLNSFEIAAKQFFGEDFDYYLRDIIGEYYKVQNAVQNNKDFLEELRRTNDSLLSTNQNEVMKTLTIVAFIFFPITFIGQLFGMSLMYIPLASNPLAFWIILTAMFISAVVIFAVFRFKKWL